MSEYRAYDNFQVNQEILKYSDEKYQFAVMHKFDPDLCEDVIWTLEVCYEDAVKRVKAETEAYGNIPEYQFRIMKIIRKQSVLMGKTQITVNLSSCEEL